MAARRVVVIALVALIVLATAATATDRKRYDGYQVIAVQPTTAHQLDLDVLRVTMQDNGVPTAQAIVSPEDLAHVRAMGGKFTVVNPDLQASLDREAARLAQRPQRFSNDTWFEDYHTYEELRDWYAEQASLHPDFVAYLPSVGKSVEERDIFGIRLTSPRGSNKPRIFFQGQIHAREWISGSTVNYVVYRLLEDYGRDSNVTTLLDEAEFVIIPVLNVDGYVYTWTNDRLWRKNRRPPPAGGTCYGIDLNRNYADHWSEAGSSSNPCSSNYHGAGPASEPEVAASQDVFVATGGIIGAIDFHSSGQLILRPYGWTDDVSPHEAEHNSLGAAMAEAIRQTSGETYTSQPSIALYPTSGSASDWFYGASTDLTGTQAYGYTIELRPDEGGQHDIPPSEIVPTGQEIYAAVKVFARTVLDNPLALRRAKHP